MAEKNQSVREERDRQSGPPPTLNHTYLINFLSDLYSSFIDFTFPGQRGMEREGFWDYGLNF